LKPKKSAEGVSFWLAFGRVPLGYTLGYNLDEILLFSSINSA